MSRGGGIPGLAVTMATAGGFLLYAGIKGVGLQDGLRQVLGGQTPTGPAPASTQVVFTPGGGAGPVGPGGIQQTGYGGQLAGAHPEIAHAALRYLGVPYRWGGKHPEHGLDCSGLVQTACRDCGISAPASTLGQATWRQTRRIPRGQVGAGDLVYWPGHIGIALDNSSGVFAPRTGLTVRVERIDTAGPRGTGAPTLCLRYAGPSAAPGAAAAPQAVWT